MRIGVGIASGRSAPALAGFARAAEQAGAASVWIPENPAVSGAFSAAGAIAALTSRVAVCIGTVSPFTRNPVVLAMEIAQLQALSEGRTVVALGAGPAQTYARWGIDASAPHAAMRECLDIVRRLTRGERVLATGRFRVNAQLVQQAPVPLYFGTMGPRLLATAGQLADGVVLSMHAPMELVSDCVRRARPTGPHAGRAFRTVALTQFALRDRVADARAALKPGLAATITRIHGNPAVERIFTAGGAVDGDRLSGIAAELRAGTDPLRAVPDELVDRLCVAGDLDRVGERIAKFAEAGVDEVVLYDVENTPATAGALRLVTDLAAGIHSGARPAIHDMEGSAI